MKRNKFQPGGAKLSLILVLAILPQIPAHATVFFQFADGSVFDNAGLVIITDDDDAAPFTTVTLTVVDIIAPEYDSTTGALTGNILSAAGGDSVTTNTANNGIGVNNPSVSNTQFGSPVGGPTGAGGESANMNISESWVISFDATINITEFNFSSLGVGDSYEVAIEDGPSMSFPDGNTNDDFSNPFGAVVIPAGKTITFTAAGSLATTDIRITSITANVIPEPSIALLGGLGVLGLLRRRRN